MLKNASLLARYLASCIVHKHKSTSSKNNKISPFALTLLIHSQIKTKAISWNFQHPDPDHNFMDFALIDFVGLLVAAIHTHKHTNMYAPTVTRQAASLTGPLSHQ